MKILGRFHVINGSFKEEDGNLMTKVFLIGDTHFFHQNIIKFAESRHFRPFDTIEEHNEEIRRRWNSVVRPNDIVKVMGDFCFGGWGNISIAATLNGIKHLIMGNHDHYDVLEFRKYFEKVVAYMPYKETLLSHMPVHESELQRWKVNIHGHKHHNIIDDERYINVSAEQINLTPISWEQLVEKHPILRSVNEKDI